MKKRRDIAIEDHGTLYLLHAISARGRRWLATHLAAPTWVSAGTYGAVVVEPRYVDDVIRGARRAGLQAR